MRDIKIFVKVGFNFDTNSVSFFHNHMLKNNPGGRVYSNIPKRPKKFYSMGLHCIHVKYEDNSILD